MSNQRPGSRRPSVGGGRGIRTHDDASAPLAVFKPAVRRSRLNPALRFHDLRHTCASLLIAADVGPKVVQKHIGHSSFAITYDRYGRLYPNEAEQQVSEAVEAAFAVRA